MGLTCFIFRFLRRPQINQRCCRQPAYGNAFDNGGNWRTDRDIAAIGFRYSGACDLAGKW
jgi:hypothetical protein